MRKAVSAFISVLAFGCGPKVQLEVPASPALALDASTVAVVSIDRECQGIANELVDALNDVGMRVDPRSAIRLDVYGCGVTYQTEVEIEQHASAEGAGVERRRARVDGRGHAAVAVRVNGVTEATLIGARSRSTMGGWQSRGLQQVLDLKRGVDQQITEDVALDLATQISPMPTLVARRVYPKAARGSARQLHTLAVHAEEKGDLAAARALAQAAVEARPESRSERAYLEELERRLQRLDASADP